MTSEWAVMIPVRGPASGKSRLGAPGPARTALARAFALDTIAAVTASPLVTRVVVITDDPGFARFLTPDVELLVEASAAGVDSALQAGSAYLGIRSARAALPADLPALHPDELTAALEQAGAMPRCVVADAEGTGTTLVTAAAGMPWRSSYGARSFARHLGLGCLPLAISPEAGLRCDVDTRAQLVALTGRLGRQTAALTAALTARHPAPATA